MSFCVLRLGAANTPILHAIVFIRPFDGRCCIQNRARRMLLDLCISKPQHAERDAHHFSIFSSDLLRSLEWSLRTPEPPAPGPAVLRATPFVVRRQISAVAAEQSRAAH